MSCAVQRDAFRRRAVSRASLSSRVNFSEMPSRLGDAPPQLYREPQKAAHDIVIRNFDPAQDLIFCKISWILGSSDSRPPFIATCSGEHS